MVRITNIYFKFIQIKMHRNDDKRKIKWEKIIKSDIQNKENKNLNRFKKEKSKIK